VADPSASETSYGELAIGPLLSLSEGLADLHPRLTAIDCPTLIFTSRVDHVVPPVSSDVLAEVLSGSVERVWLERSYHTATLDFDRAEIERRSVEFARKVTAG
jgi:carboxylesterase